MNAIVLFCLIGAAVATRTQLQGTSLFRQYPFLGKEGSEFRSEVIPETFNLQGVSLGQFPVVGKEGSELRSEVLPEIRSEIEYPLYQYGRHSASQMHHYPQHYSRMSYEYPMYGQQYYPEVNRAFPHLFPKYYNVEQPIYEKSYYPEMHQESSYMTHYPYYRNYEYPVYKYQKYEYPVYKHEEYATPAYSKGYPWVHSQYYREHPIYKSYPIDYQYIH